MNEEMDENDNRAGRRSSPAMPPTRRILAESPIGDKPARDGGLVKGRTGQKNSRRFAPQASV